MKSSSSAYSHIFSSQKSGTVAVFRVSPGASRSSINGLYGDKAIKISIQAPANDNKANEALRKFLAKEFQIRINDVEIIQGEKSRTKTIFLDMPLANVLSRISVLLKDKL